MEKVKYQKLWACMHDNPHHHQMDDLNTWYEHMKKIYDFWPIAYYPFGMVPTETDFGTEDLLPEDKINADWEIVRQLVKKANKEGYPMFMGYEWQGSGLDGDHNVFFLNNDQDMKHPIRYEELYEEFKDVPAIAIPHHLAYHLGDRGKNWSTHIEEFSPFAEIYSSHGSSESDQTNLSMVRHIHMGPRVSNTSYEAGLAKGFKIGCICSGDNHIHPGQYDNGTMCVLAENNSKEAIWDGLINKRVYGTTFGRMDIDFSMDDQIIGGIVKENENAKVEVKVIGDNAIDRIDLIKDNIVTDTYIHSGKWENKEVGDNIRFKFQTEFGWGPDMRIFKDIYKKEWKVKMITTGKIVSVEKNWNSIGQEVIHQGGKDFECKLTTFKSTGSGKWMGTTNVKQEGFTFELEGRLDDKVTFYVDRKAYEYTYEELLKDSHINADLEGSHKLIEERYGQITSHRNDTWWHNAYKFKIHQGVLEAGYSCQWKTEISTIGAKNVRIRVYQKNGAIAFVSPIFIEGGK
jgi:hypothetical protein